MDASQLPKGKSLEKTSDGRLINQPGIYTHKDTGGTYITAPGEEGVVQADALMSPVWKDAWEWTAPVPNRLELIEMRKAQLLKDKKAEAAEKKADEADLAEVAPDPPAGKGVTFDPVEV